MNILQNKLLNMTIEDLENDEIVFEEDTVMEENDDLRHKKKKLSMKPKNPVIYIENLDR